MTKEEILKSWDKYEIFSKTYFELAISAMQEYADQQTSELKTELNELKERHKLAMDLVDKVKNYQTNKVTANELYKLADKILQTKI